MDTIFTDSFLKLRAEKYDRFQFCLEPHLPSDFNSRAYSVSTHIEVCGLDEKKLWGRTLYFHHFIKGQGKILDDLLRTTKLIMQLPSRSEALCALLYLRILIEDFERFKVGKRFIVDDLIEDQSGDETSFRPIFGRDFLSWWIERALQIHTLNSLTEDQRLNHRTWTYRHLGPCDLQIMDEHVRFSVEGKQLTATGQVVVETIRYLDNRKAYSSYKSIAPKFVADHLQDNFDLKTIRPKDVLKKSPAWETLILRTHDGKGLFLNPNAEFHLVSP